MAKKKKKSKEEEHKDVQQQFEEVFPSVSTLETFMEETQYTDTSYTSASLETLPTPPLRSELNLKEKKRKRKKGEMSSSKSERSMFSSDTVTDDSKTIPHIEDTKKGKKKGKKKGDKLKTDEQLPHFDKPRNWKKMNVKEQADWMAQRIEQYRLEVEAAKVAQLAGAKEKKVQRAKERNELMAEEAVKQNVRRDTLAKTCNLFQKHEKLRLEHDFKDLLELQWKNYIKCNGLPEPTQLTQLNSYMSQWASTTYHDCTDKELTRRFFEVMPTLEMINRFASKTNMMSQEKIQSMLKARTELRNQLSKAIECTCFHMLRDLDKNLKFESTKTATYHKELEELNLHIWVAIKQPTKLKTKDDPPPDPVDLEFPDLRLHITLPTVFNSADICVRVGRGQTDLYSSTGRTYEIALEMPNRNEDLFTFNVKEFIYINQIAVEYEEIRTRFYKETNTKIREMEKYFKANPYLKTEKEKEELEALHLAEPPVLLGEQNPRLRIIKENDDNLTKYLNSCMYKLQPGEIDSRKYRICGGVLYVDLFETPPQAKYIRHGIYLSTLILPNGMKDIFYSVDYNPAPETPGSGDNAKSAEDMEKNMAEKEKLVIIDMFLPHDVIWLEQPTICQWQESKKTWTSKHIFDVNYNRIEQSMNFKTAVLWPIGIASFRYSNMPYKDWEMKKDPLGKGVLFTVNGIFLTVKLLCRNRCVVLKELYGNTDSKALEKYLNQAMTVPGLKRVLQDAGCDIFPDFDGHNYIRKSCPKTWVPERHLYHAMSFLSKAYNFRYSRWNSRVGSRHFVCQIREHTDRKRESKFQLLYASPESATLLKSGEEMEEFNEEPAFGLSFYPDLFTFNLDYGSTEAKKRTFAMSYKLTETIFELLQEIKPLSFA